MAPFLNPQDLLLRALKSGNPLDPNFSVADPSFISQPAMPTKPDASGGMLNPAGVAPGGAGTAVGQPAGPQANPNIIRDPDELRQTVTRMLQEPAPAVQMPAAPQYPAAPGLEPRPTGWGGRALLERITGAMAGMGGQMNPFEVQRREREAVAQQHYGTQVGAIQQQWMDKLKAAEAQQKAELERYQAQRQMLMGLGYALPAFGISRTGGGAGNISKISQVLKFNQGMPVSVTDPQTGQIYPIDPTDKNLSQIPNQLKPLVMAAQRQHGAWYNEQQKLIQTRGEAFRLNTMYPVMDAEDGMAPIYARGYEILNNPGRYVAGSLGQQALNRENILMDIGDMSKIVRQDFHALRPEEEFSAQQRAVISAALGAPAGTAEQYIQSFPRMGMTQAQVKLATDLIQLKENAMAMRGILPGGNTETMRAAVANTLPGAGTPSVPYADQQLDALDRQIARLSRGIPKVAMRTPGGEIPTAGEGGAAPAPARGPVASQGPLNIQARTAPKNIRNAADIQGQIPEYVRDPQTGKLKLKGTQ